MSDATLLVHDVHHPTVTLFVDPNPLREKFLEEYPEEDGPILTVRIDVPDGIEVEPSHQSKLSPGYNRPENEYMLIADSDELQRASFDFAVAVPNRGHLESESIRVTLLHEGRVLDHAHILV